MSNIDHEAPSFLRSRGGLALCVVAAVGGFLLFTEHRAHLLGALPYLLLLACPLMHVFMHRGHHHGSHNHSPGPRSEDERPGQ